jgi:hypothetical protein
VSGFHNINSFWPNFQFAVQWSIDSHADLLTIPQLREGFNRNLEIQFFRTDYITITSFPPKQFKKYKLKMLLLKIIL